MGNTIREKKWHVKQMRDKMWKKLSVYSLLSAEVADSSEFVFGSFRTQSWTAATLNCDNADNILSKACDSLLSIQCCELNISESWFLDKVALCRSGSGGAGIHLLLAAVPEVQQPVVFVGTEVGEVSEQAVGQPLVPQHARPPGFGQHGVVGPVVTHPLLATEWPMAVGGGGVSAAPLLPTRVLPLGVGQLQEDCACWSRGSAFTSQHVKSSCVLILWWTKPVMWIYCGLFSAGKLKAEAENLSCTKPNLEEKEHWHILAKQENSENKFGLK